MKGKIIIGKVEIPLMIDFRAMTEVSMNKNSSMGTELELFLVDMINNKICWTKKLKKCKK